MFGGEIILNSMSDCIVCGTRGREVMRNNLLMFLCDECGLFWRRSFELNDRHYEQRGFELENSDKINARYTNSIERIGTLRKYIRLDNVCDVGCGEGVFLKALSDLGYKNTIGLEPSIKAQGYALVNNLKIFEGDVEDMNSSFFKKHDTHVVTMFHVVEHLKNPKEVIKRIYDNLNTGDFLILETPDTNSLVFKKTNYKNEFIYLEHLYYFNKKNIKKLLEDIGFKIVSIGHRDFDPENMSIRDSLARLGFGQHKDRPPVKNTKKWRAVQKIEINDNITKKIVRTALSRLVTLFNRGNYLWVIAKK